jgi:hypothetical protein
MKIVHLWSPMSFHEPQWVVGNKAGLQALRDAIDIALKTHGSACAEVFTNDGEGYDLGVHCIADSDIDNLAVPYTESYAKEHREHAVFPWDGT